MAVKRPSRFAENLFATLCSAGGAKAHKAQEDENGWDYFVELPIGSHLGPLDTQPAEPTAFVQVKSKTTRGLSIEIKLSNALKAAASALPFFIVLVVIPKGATTHKVYAKHVWTEMITSALREGRLAERDGTAPNKKRIPVKFSPNDEVTGGIVSWMVAQISMIEGDYQSKKAKLYHEIGHDTSLGSLTFQGTMPEIYRAFLGIGNGLPVKNFSYSPLRFGISSPKSDIKGASGTVYIEPKPISDCEIKLQGSADTPAIAVAAKLYYYNPTDRTADGSFRASTGAIELLHGPEGVSGFSYNLDPTALLSIKALHDYVLFNCWRYRSARISAEVIHESGMRLFRGTISEPAGPRGDWDDILKIADTLKTIVGSSKFEISLAEFQNRINDLNFVHQMITASTMHYEAKISDAPPAIDFLAYYCHLQLGDYHLVSIMRRAKTDRQFVDDTCIFDFGVVADQENYVLRSGMGDAKTIAQKVYDDKVGRLGESCRVLNVGDMRAFADQLNALNATA
ncbi:hypothetical protein QY049_03320 [Bradyrhizobium sp. WYCCWR 13022]|uniref:hypothetical protein n=1 Tax=unclassified Bradyrhizobium TaxID=2631580 RepID=UPI00263B75DE|nr:hypothetical protein [Bradyrhizobium sp. WYCCWR 13022]MDN4982256.1 hypothetical protein [Bradyrhizobium sp. WYCCWR 13022]